MTTYKEYADVPAYQHATYKDGLPVRTDDGALLWAGKVPPPPVGARIEVRINNCGPAVVVGYFAQDGYLGLRVQHDNPPDWYIKQNKGNVVGHVFGPEFDMVKGRVMTTDDDNEPMTEKEFRAAMTALGLNQTTICERIGVTRRTSAGYAAGTTPVPLATAKLLRIWVQRRQSAIKAAKQRA